MVIEVMVWMLVQIADGVELVISTAFGTGWSAILSDAILRYGLPLWQVARHFLAPSAWAAIIVVAQLYLTLFVAYGFVRLIRAIRSWFP